MKHIDFDENISDEADADDFKYHDCISKIKYILIRFLSFEKDV